MLARHWMHTNIYICSRSDWFPLNIFKCLLDNKFSRKFLTPLTFMSDNSYQSNGIRFKVHWNRTNGTQIIDDIYWQLHHNEATFGFGNMLRFGFSLYPRKHHCGVISPLNRHTRVPLLNLHGNLPRVLVAEVARVIV